MKLDLNIMVSVCDSTTSNVLQDIIYKVYNYTAIVRIMYR